MAPVELVLFLAALLLSAMIHEQWHARVALWLGDPTGRDENRLSWNPVHHLDPWMSFLLPALLWISTKGAFVFGGAKPVRINPLHFRNPTLGMALSAAAGPLSNFALAAIGFGVLGLLLALAPGTVLQGGQATWNSLFLRIFIMTNLVLGAFNLLPFPGLDGSRILYHFAPRPLRALLDAVEPFALGITLLLVSLPGLNLVGPVFGLGIELFLHFYGLDVTRAVFLAR